MEKHYTVKEVSQLLGLAEVTIRQWLSQKKIKSVRIGGAVRIAESELKKLIKE